ncbi:codeine O-demethylase-like [Coffea eugenioides]|uniref:codeine O-demethylase-like n=1 Tax=Coffea eugenioides TaxID=49369 RepID=UPI000F60AD86|nr:codeine O-demethylase-like [Coffea eugenioides]
MESTDEHQALAVEELAIKANSPPTNYIVKDSESIISTTLPILEIPTIDTSLLSSSSFEAAGELRRLRTALRSCGYFQAINHGMSASFLDEVLEVTGKFFKLPLDEKRTYSRDENGIDGYGNDVIYSDRQTLDWNDRLYLHVLPESIRKCEKWPRLPQNFREILLEFTERLRVMNEIIVKAMEKSLDLGENCFLDQFGKNPISLTRFNFYPPCPWPDRILAVKPHGDASGTTYLLQDKEVEGLQVLKDDHWYRVPLTPDAIVFNCGDQLEIMTNGIFKSPIHRVVTNKEKERRTVALFFSPELTSEIKPAEGLIDDKHPKLYKSVIDYTRNYFEHLQNGRRPIDALKI